MTSLISVITQHYKSAKKTAFRRLVYLLQRDTKSVFIESHIETKISSVSGQRYDRCLLTRSQAHNILVM